MSADVRGRATGDAPVSSAPLHTFRAGLDEVVVIAQSRGPFTFTRDGHRLEVELTPMLPTILHRDVARQLETQGVLTTQAKEGSVFRRMGYVRDWKP